MSSFAKKVTYMVTPGGEELAILPRAELDEIIDALERRNEVSAYEQGKLPGLGAEEALEFATATSPLAFWRRRAGLSQKQLAEKVGIAQGYVSDLENGSRMGNVKLWLRISDALGVPIESLVDDEA